MATEAGLLGIYSFVLTMTNILCIIGKFNEYLNLLPTVSFSFLVVAMIILRIKEVLPTMGDDEISIGYYFLFCFYMTYNIF